MPKSSLVTVPLIQAHPMAGFLTVARIKYAVQPLPGDLWSFKVDPQDADKLEAAVEYGTTLKR